MPLTLECYCTDDATVCQLSALYFEFFADYEQFGPNEASSVITLTHDPTLSSETEVASFTSPSNGLHSTPISLGLADLAEWKSLKVYINVASSLFQPPSSAPARWTFSFWIRLLYTCTNLATAEVVKTKSIYSAPSEDLGSGVEGFCTCFDGIERVRITPLGIKWVDEDGELNQIAGAVGDLWTSSPLGSCYGCTVEFGPGFIPFPKAEIIDIDAGSTVCLCASGGTAPYFFFVRSGRLPEGMALNSSTGCLEGTATGPGSGEVEFGVIDADGGEATATCVYGKQCEQAAPPVVNAFY